MAHQAPHRTPLRRVSQGSLFRLSRSNAYPDAPHGLGFLVPALGELADETDTLHTNVENLRSFSDSLERFNESFASWLYVMNMNALTVDWPQAPTDASFVLARRRAEEEARATAEALRKAAEPPPPPPPAEPSVADKTAMSTADGEGPSKPKAKTALVKKGKKPPMTAKQKRERSLELEKIVNALPLEFRGNDVTLRKHTEQVIEGFLNSPGKGLKQVDFIKPPDLNQARVNKVLIALVNRKIVTKESSAGVALYHWRGVA